MKNAVTLFSRALHLNNSYFAQRLCPHTTIYVSLYYCIFRARWVLWELRVPEDCQAQTGQQATLARRDREGHRGRLSVRLAPPDRRVSRARWACRVWLVCRAPQAAQLLRRSAFSSPSLCPARRCVFERGSEKQKERARARARARITGMVQGRWALAALAALAALGMRMCVAEEVKADLCC